MPREKVDYRDYVARLDAAFPGRELVAKSEIAGWLGISKRTLLRRYELPPGQYVTKTALARALSA